jgi:hypothetical protein
MPLPSPFEAPPWSRRRWYERLARVQRLEAPLYAELAEQMLEIERLAFMLDDER